MFLCLNAEAILKPEHRTIRILISLIILSIPFIITGFPHKTSDKTYVGRVENIEVKTTTSSNFGGRHNNIAHCINIVYLNVVTHDGKSLRKKVYTARADQKQAYNLYEVGDTVFHLYGTKSVVVLPRKKDTHFECAVCEDVNDVKNTVCRSCGHTLINSENSLFSNTYDYIHFK